MAMEKGKTMSTDRYSFRLTIEAKDEGERQFQEFRSFESQDQMCKETAFVIARALRAAFLCPPCSWDIMAAMDNHGITYGLGRALSTYWDGENNLSEVVSITVDIGKLMPQSEQNAKYNAGRVLQSYGIKIDAIPNLK